MGKLLVLSLSDCEEYIFNRIMAVIANDPKLNHIVLPPSDISLSFPNLEIRLKEQTVSCSGQPVTLTHHEFAVLTYLLVIPAGYSQPARFMRPYGIETVNTAVPLLPASSVKSGAS